MPSHSGYSDADALRFEWGGPPTLVGLPDVPAPADVDGDGRTDFAVWRPSNGTWYRLLSSGNYSYATSKAYPWGLPGDVPLGRK